MKAYDIKNLLGAIDFEKNKLHKTKHNLYLTTYEIAVLKKFHIDYDNYQTAKQILQQIEQIIPDLDNDEQEELDEVSISIAERDYYQNTNK